MPERYDRCSYAPWEEEADELVDLVEVILGLDVVFLSVQGIGLGRFLRRELEHCGESDGGAVEGDEAEFEELGHVYVEG